MNHIYRRVNSDGATALVAELRNMGLAVRRTKVVGSIAAGDRVVCWGDFLPLPRNTQALNNVSHISKYAEIMQLAQANVPTVQVSREHRVGWLPRRNNHIGGSDLLRPPPDPDYYSKKENIANEYRLHMFNGNSIRAGQKRQRPARPDGSPPHPWIRSFDAGWIIAYNGFRSTPAMRRLAAQAVRALDLTFGAVDLAETANGRLLVLEVNRAPGIEGSTVTAYATRIAEWFNQGR